ncbi:MAG TPA: hypothetical protein PL182_05730 [Pseudobdellovibrionaceae bacterium]|nr:hypothetical protein [Pseudobdellovibrionaceae bacterium]
MRIRGTLTGWIIFIVLALTFQNCGRLAAFDFGSGQEPLTVKDLAVQTEWEKIRSNFESYIRTAPTPTSAYPLYNVQLSTAPLLQYAVEKTAVDLLGDLRDLYLLGADHLKTLSTIALYSPAFFDGDGNYTTSYIADVHLDRPFRIWADDRPPSGGSSAPGESVLVSAQFLYPVSVVIWDAARRNALSDPKTAHFVDVYWNVIVKDHLLRWIFNEGTLNHPGSSKTAGGLSNPPGFGTFSLRGWGCNDGDFNHSERVSHLRNRRFGTSYFLPLYPGSSASDRGYCNSVHDTDLWILGITAHVLAANRLAPSRLPLSASDFTRLRNHLLAGLDLVQNRIQYQTATDFQGAPVETAQWELGGFDGHPDYDYSADKNPVFPGYAVEGGSAARAPNPAINVGWDVSHARRLVAFFWTVETLNAPLALNFPIQRVMRGMANQVAYVTFNKNLSSPNFSNFLDGTDGWYRVNYSGRVNFGYPPGNWSLGGGSILSGGYGFWAKYNPDIGKIIDSAARRYPFSDALSWSRIEAFPSYPLSYFE